MAVQDWEIEIYPPPQPNWPYVVVTRWQGKAPNAQFETTADSAKLLKDQIHERLWRAANVKS